MTRLSKIAAIALGLLGIVLVGWSAWLYHFAAVADTTDEPTTFWIATGSVMLVFGCAAVAFALRSFRHGRRP